MLIYLLRHGDALQEIQDDRRRPLSDEGKTSVEKVAAFVLQNKIHFTRIITSPLLRAWQTANIVTDALRLTHKIEESDSLMPYSNPDDILRHLATLDGNESVLLVSHQPFLGNLISHLAGKELEKIEVKKASLACVRIEQPITPGMGVLSYLFNYGKGVDFLT